ncbi:FG-GAP-like repeat-containing protein [Thiolapillus sp.]|uniref:FG-GAP-like repeat-containing protein n=2 Tax=Thiolapillus sp. TaxID=2017437 RepID=UPI0025EE4836|nr:FG-GAP-like repeat-containing protein [Thiolapillus sp.]
MALLQLLYLLLGVTVLGFNRTPGQLLVVITSACVLDVVLHRLIRGSWLFPLSAFITGLSLSLLVNYAHGLWLPLIPVFLAIGSKYLFSVDGRHVYNPSLFGIVASLVLANDMISVSPAYQWNGIPALGVFIATAAILLFGLRIRRSVLVVAFLGFFLACLGLRAWIMRHHIPPETLILGTLSAPAFYLFTFFMITDPATSPESRKGQVFMALVIVLVDFFLHIRETLSTLFYAAFVWYSLYGLWRLWESCRAPDKGPGERIKILAGGFRCHINWRERLRTVLALGLLAGAGLGMGRLWLMPMSQVDPGFVLVEIPAAQAGISTHPGQVLQQVDPRLRHVAKWLLSVGDAVAVADFDGDGWQDLFVTYPLKAPRDRAALYRNLGGFRFQRVPLPALDNYVQHPRTQGLPSGALWFDYDNDGDKDLLVLSGYGYPRLLANRLAETGEAGFEDVSQTQLGRPFTVSLTANVLDMDRDGWLDLYIGNAMPPYLSGYDRPTPFTIFDLPDPEYPGDRRALNVMPRSWHNADNGGRDLFFFNRRGRLEAADVDGLGLGETRWTLDIGAGDLNGDGWTDLYVANDFGPDSLYINRRGQRFEAIRGVLRNTLGRDTYKGMNASLGDIDGNGFDDIYVSNVHEPLQAEGSLLWMNDGQVDSKGADAFRDEATRRNALNPRRFGWGGAMGDMDRDGRLDILHANGMVDDAYDRIYPACGDYWYWNARIALTGPDIHGYADSWADLRGRCIFPYEKNRVMLNQGQFFVDVADRVGWTQKDNARGIALADLDNDGDLDVLMTHQFQPLGIFRNDAAVKGWLGLELHEDGKHCNRDALGTRVEIRYGDPVQRQVREVHASNGLSAQGDARLLFGLGDYQGDVLVRIRWCGDRQQERHVASGRYLRIDYPSSS